MVEKLPGTGSVPPASEVGCDTSDILIIHNLLRYFYRDASDLVRHANGDSGGQANAVGDHLFTVGVLLHHHHQVEDDVIWDKLESRAPACAMHIGQMKEQHRQIAAMLERQAGAVDAWRSSRSDESATTLTAVLDEIAAALGTHLGQEEDKIVPEIARTWTQKEWDAAGAYANKIYSKAWPMRTQLTYVGYILDSQPAEAREKFKREFLPTPLRLLWTVRGQRLYRAHRRAVYGTAA